MSNIESILVTMQSNMQTMQSDMHTVKTEMREGFKQVNSRIDSVDARLDAVDARFEGFDKRIAEVEEFSGALYGKMCALEGNFYNMEERLSERIDNIRKDIKIGFDGVGRYLRAIDIHVTRHTDILTDHEVRIRKLEDEEQNE